MLEYCPSEMTQDQLDNLRSTKEFSMPNDSLNPVTSDNVLKGILNGK